MAIDFVESQHGHRSVIQLFKGETGIDKSNCDALSNHVNPPDITEQWVQSDWRTDSVREDISGYQIVEQDVYLQGMIMSQKGVPIEQIMSDLMDDAWRSSGERSRWVKISTISVCFISEDPIAEGLIQLCFADAAQDGMEHAYIHFEPGSSVDLRQKLAESGFVTWEHNNEFMVCHDLKNRLKTAEKRFRLDKKGLDIIIFPRVSMGANMDLPIRPKTTYAKIQEILYLERKVYVTIEQFLQSDSVSWESWLESPHFQAYSRNFRSIGEKTNTRILTLVLKYLEPFGSILTELKINPPGQKLEHFEMFARLLNEDLRDMYVESKTKKNVQQIMLFNDGKYVGHVYAWEPTWRECQEGEEPGSGPDCQLISFAGIRSSIANFLKPEVHRVSWKILKGVADYAEKLAGKPVYIGLGYTPIGRMGDMLKECGFKGLGSPAARTDMINCQQKSKRK